MRTSFRDWLNRPQKTNRDGIVVGVIGGILLFIITYGGGELLDLAGVVTFRGSIPVWLAATLVGLAIGLALVVGIARGQRLQSRIDRLQEQATELGSYGVYAEHLQDVLAELRDYIAGLLPTFSLRDFIEKGVFETAHRLLTREGERGDVRFSILHLDNSDFVMVSAQGDVFPAFGHRMKSRQRFRIPISGSFSGLALQNDDVYASGNLSDDHRFKPHPKAERPYESIVSVPLHSEDEVHGVFNVVAEAEEAFNEVDRTYLTLLGSVIDVARAAHDAQGKSSGGTPVPPDEQED